MMSEDPGDRRSGAEKQAYLSNIRDSLTAKKATLSGVMRKILLVTESGRMHVNEQLRKAERQAEFCIADLMDQIDQLESADDESWEARRFDVEVASDELSQSIKKIVARIPLRKLK